MLQTIRDYARERLAEAEESAHVEGRHAGFFRDFSRRVELGLEGKDQLDWMRQGIREDGNIDAAFDWCRRAGEEGDDEAVEAGLAMCGSLIMFWHIRALHIHMRAVTDALVAARRTEGPTPGWLGAMNAAALASLHFGEVPRALEECALALKGAIELDLPRETAAYHVYMGANTLIAGELERSDEHLSAGAALAEAVGHGWAKGIALAFHGMLAAATGQPDLARTRLESSLEICEKSGEREGQGVALSGLAQLAMGEGDLEAAMDLYERAKDTFGQIGDRPEQARVQDEMAWCTLAAGHLERARGLFLGSMRAHDSVGSTRGMGLALIGLASVEVASGRPERGAVIAAAAEVFSEQEGVVVTYPWVTDAQRDVSAALEALDPTEREARTKQGRALSVQEAVAYVNRLGEPDAAHAAP
jgi:tetratricopeptide (TPR) repeat protein